MATIVSYFANDNDYYYPIGAAGGNMTWKRLKPIELCKLSKCFFSFDRHLIRKLHRKYIFEREPENVYWIPQKMKTMNIVMRLSLSLSRDYEETLNWQQTFDTFQRYQSNSISYSSIYHYFVSQLLILLLYFRWTKLRFAMIPFTVFLEPFSECMLSGALAALASFLLFRYVYCNDIGIWLFFTFLEEFGQWIKKTLALAA